MLIGQHCRRNQHGYLLGIAGRFESSTHSYLCLSKANIATNESVHRLGALHISFYILRRLQLIGRVFIEKARL